MGYDAVPVMTVVIGVDTYGPSALKSAEEVGANSGTVTIVIRQCVLCRVWSLDAKLKRTAILRGLCFFVGLGPPFVERPRGEVAIIL